MSSNKKIFNYFLNKTQNKATHNKQTHFWQTLFWPYENVLIMSGHSFLIFDELITILRIFFFIPDVLHGGLEPAEQ